MSRREEINELPQYNHRHGAHGGGGGPPPTYQEAVHHRTGLHEPVVLETNVDEDDVKYADEYEEGSSDGTSNGESSQEASRSGHMKPELRAMLSVGVEEDDSGEDVGLDENPTSGDSEHAVRPTVLSQHVSVLHAGGPREPYNRHNDEDRWRNYTARWRTYLDDNGTETVQEVEMTYLGSVDGHSEEDPVDNDNQRQLESEASLREVELDFSDQRASPVRRRSIDLEAYNRPDIQSSRSAARRRSARDYECSSFPVLTPVYSHIRKALSRTSGTRKILIFLTVVGILGLLLLVSLLPSSFIYVDYYEMGFSRNKVTGAHDYSEVYQTGCYLLAPQDELVTFSSTAHLLVLDLSVMNSMGMEIGLEVMAQYFIRPEELRHLFHKYHRDYPDVIYSVAESTIKNAAVDFSMEEFRLNRSYVEAQIFRKLRNALSGDCCAPCCPGCASEKIKCGLEECKTVGCSSGYHVDLRYFQLGKVTVPQLILDQYMKAVTLQIDAEKEFHIQNRAVIKITTVYKVQKIRNEAEEIRKAAEADRHLILATAEATKERDVQKSYLNALMKLFGHLNITTEEEQTSFMYLKALKDASENLYTSFNYDKQSILSP